MIYFENKSLIQNYLAMYIFISISCNLKWSDKMRGKERDFIIISELKNSDVYKHFYAPKH